MRDELNPPDIETASDAYAARFAGSAGAFMLDVQLHYTLDLLKPWTAPKILDVGGGHGQLAIPLVRQGRSVTVTGSAPICEQRLSRELAPGSYTFHTCNLFALPFADRSFDVVMAFRLLPHLEHWDRFIAELCRVAREAVIVDYPDLKSVNLLHERMFGLKKAVEGNTRPYRCFQQEEILAAFKAAGFGATAVRPQFFVPMAAHRMMRSRTLSRALESAARSTGLTSRWGSPVIVRAMRMRP